MVHITLNESTPLKGNCTVVTEVEATSMLKRAPLTNAVVIAAIVTAVFGLAASAAPQSRTSSSSAPADKRPNIAVSGCMMRQGYATFRIDDARVDAIGDKAANAEPSSERSTEGLRTPSKWILDNAGTAGQHVGEKVQVIGVSDWVTSPNDYPVAPEEPGGPPPPMPHIDVLSLKMIASKCS